jgi:hypothetical protein
MAWTLLFGLNLALFCSKYAHFKKDCNAVTGLEQTENEENWQTIKCKVVPAHATKVYSKNGGTPPLILNLGTRWRQVINMTPRPVDNDIH